MPNLWFSADHHFGHKNIIKLQRPAFASVEEMNEALIQYWNELVQTGDEVWHLGDFAFHNAGQFRKRLNGNIHLIQGNHDKESSKLYHHLFASVHDLYRIKSVKPHIILCHYAMRVWSSSCHGSWHLYGHSHGHLADLVNSLSFDVGVDCWNYRPVSYEQVVERMNKKIHQLGTIT